MKLIALGITETDMRFPKNGKRAGKKVCIIEVTESGIFRDSRVRTLTVGDYRKAMKKPIEPINAHLPAFLTKKEANKFSQLFFPKVDERSSRL